MADVVVLGRRGDHGVGSDRGNRGIPASTSGVVALAIAVRVSASRSARNEPVLEPLGQLNVDGLKRVAKPAEIASARARALLRRALLHDRSVRARRRRDRDRPPTAATRALTSSACPAHAAYPEFFTTRSLSGNTGLDGRS